MIGVDARGDFEALVPKLMDVIKRAAKEGDIVDVIQLDDSGASRYMRDETKPFYRRRLFGLF